MTSSWARCSWVGSAACTLSRRLRFRPKRSSAFGSGRISMLSALNSPKIFPRFSSTPTTWKTRPRIRSSVPSGSCAGEEPVGHVEAHDHHRTGLLDLVGGEEPPGGDGPAAGVDPLGGRPLDDDVGLGLGDGAGDLVRPEPGMRRGGAHRGTPLAHRPEVLQAEVRPALVPLPVDPPEVDAPRPLGDGEDVGPELGQIGGHLGPEPLDQRHHRHHGGDADHHPEQGQQRAQRVRRQRPHRQPDVVPQGDEPRLPSFVPERLDRIEPGGARRRPDAEE